MCSNDYEDFMIDMSVDKGYAPDQVFYPVESFSAGLLRSIPKKVHEWLLRLGVRDDVAGEAHGVRWNFSVDGGTIIYGSDGDSDFIQIWWESIPSTAAFICCTDERCLNLKHNLPWFVTVEQNIYGALQTLEDSMDIPYGIPNETTSADDVIGEEE